MPASATAPQITEALAGIDDPAQARTLLASLSRPRLVAVATELSMTHRGRTKAQLVDHIARGTVEARLSCQAIRLKAAGR